MKEEQSVVRVSALGFRLLTTDNRPLTTGNRRAR